MKLYIEFHSHDDKIGLSAIEDALRQIIHINATSFYDYFGNLDEAPRLVWCEAIAHDRHGVVTATLTNQPSNQPSTKKIASNFSQ